MKAVIIVQLVLLVAIVSSIYLTTDRTTIENMKSYEIAQDLILEELKAPLSAVFPDITEVTVKEQNHRVYVTGYVDAQNSFGALIRKDFVVWYYVKQNGEILSEVTLINK
jgi:hypothetical protein